MSARSEPGMDVIAGRIAVVVGILCALFGFDRAEWGGALVAGVLGFGAAHLLFAAIGLAFRLIIGAALLMITGVVLYSRITWLAELFQ